jgi:hypothetical protein
MTIYRVKHEYLEIASDYTEAEGNAEFFITKDEAIGYSDSLIEKFKVKPGDYTIKMDLGEFSPLGEFKFIAPVFEVNKGTTEHPFINFMREVE